MTGSKTELREATPIPDLTFPMNVFHLHGKHRLIAIHWHDHLEWIYIRAGQAKVQLDDMFIVAREGDIIFVNSQQIHGATSMANNTELYAIVVDQNVLLNAGLDCTDPRYFRRIVDHKIPIPSVFRGRHLVAKDLARSLVAIVDEFQNQHTAYELFIKAELFQAFAVAVRYSGTNDGPSPMADHQNRFGQLLAYLRQNYTTKVPLAQAAQFVNLSPSQFCMRFKNITGKTFIEYVNALRIEEAEKLLEQTGLPVAQIAEMVGLSNSAYFARVFNKHHHLSPSEYRRLRRLTSLRTMF